MAGSKDDIPPPPPSQIPIQQTPHTVSTIKLPILKEEMVLERERKARTTLLMALPEDHLAKFHKITDAKEMWEAIKSRFGGNDESKKMKKFQSLLSQLEIHGAVFEYDVKGSTASPSSTQNVAFVSENTSSTNDVSTANGVSNSFGHNSQFEHPSSYSLLANQSNCPQLDHEDLEQLNEFDLKEMDLKWQVAMISMRMKKFYKRQVESYNLMPRNRLVLTKPKSSAIVVTRQGILLESVDSRGIKIVGGEMLGTLGIRIKKMRGDLVNRRTLKLCSSGSDTEVLVQKNAYTQALKKVEAQLVAHQQSQLWYEEKIRFMKIDLDDKTDVLTYHKKLLAEAEKEKEELKAKVEKWHNSSKNLNILLNSQMIARDKAGLGYGDQMNKGVLSYENEVFRSVFISRTSDIEDNPMNDRYAKGSTSLLDPIKK
ncbi:hypothetical protein Tco_1252271 [Tanacetum coccineum]